MNAREKILGKIRDAQLRSKANNGASVENTLSIAQHLAQHPRGPQPPVIGDLLKNFKERCLKLSSDVLETNNRGDVPNLVARYLNEKNLPTQGVCWPLLSALPWREAGLDIQSRPSNSQDAVGVTGAFCAIAETGTLMTLSGKETPPSTSLLPETHVAILEPSRIVASMEDAWELVRKEFKQPPRVVNFISGPSRTADIEMTVTMGAHGPYRVLVIIAPLT